MEETEVLAIASAPLPTARGAAGSVAELLNLETLDICPVALAALPAREIARRQILPYRIEGGRLLVAAADRPSASCLDTLRMICRLPLRVRLAEPGELRDRIKDLVGLGGGTLQAVTDRRFDQNVAIEEEDGVADEASIVRLVHELLEDALLRGASDVHLEPTAEGMLIRYRIDGILSPESSTQQWNRLRDAIVSRIKIMARLNIAEKRQPQDGRVRIRLKEGEKDIRVSIIPMLHGEGVVLRLLDPVRAVRQLQKLQLPGQIGERFQRLIGASHGIILVTGPTGSGKTTTLSSALLQLRSPKTKIVTIEDPVEYELEGVNQIPIQTKTGMSFAASLRSVLRHDPDVILVGEIRDSETATAAIQAAMTGHLVFSTLHTNDAPSAYARLIDMGVEPYLAADAVIGVLAQRLVRRLCISCREPVDLDLCVLPSDFPDPCMEGIYQPVGCRDCRMTGYQGRMGIYELVISTPAIREACCKDASASAIRQAAKQAGYQSLRLDGWQRVLEGLTSIEEVLRVSGLEPTSQEADRSVGDG
ncbi:MAG: GspE/PulE family protein [Pirellulaceae bacterium]|jgi:type II secretory ATPase GspE/PulE/Tfp pilus assembly ATPase PilB-like protein